jgi:Ser-tRNA(Ala) deacylase AlaX
MIIDQEVRKKNARLHSAGHLLDVAVNRLKLDWRPGKGYHFQDSPYVEYIGVCEDNQKVKEQLQKEIDDLLVSSPEAKVDVQYLGVH